MIRRGSKTNPYDALKVDVPKLKIISDSSPLRRENHLLNHNEYLKDLYLELDWVLYHQYFSHLLKFFYRTQ